MVELVVVMTKKKKAKAKARPHSQRSPLRAHGSGSRGEEDDSAGPSSPKRQAIFCEAIAEASQAAAEQNATGDNPAPPRSSLKRAMGEFDTSTDFGER